MTSRGQGVYRSEVGISARVEQLLNARLEENERFINNVSYVQNLNSDPHLNEHKLKILLEDRELELNSIYVANFDKINNQIQCFVDKICQMNTICRDLTYRIQSNKEKTRDLLKKTSALQTEKKTLTAKKEYLDKFFGKYYLTEEENQALIMLKTEGTVSESFFKVFKRLLSINEEVLEQLKLNSDNLSLLEISGFLKGKIDLAYQTLYQSVLRECRLLNVHFLDIKLVVCQSFEYLQMRPDLFENALKEYGLARKSNVVRAYIDALAKGEKSNLHKPIESFSNEPIRYVVELFTWIQTCISLEKNLIVSMLKNSHSENTGYLIKDILSSISEALCQPLKMRLQQIILKESNPVAFFKLSSILLYYEKSFSREINANSVLIKMLHDLYELTLNMFFSIVSTNVQRILSNMTVPDYNLLPVNAVHQLLLLLRDVLEPQNDTTFSSVIDKKEIHSKIFLHTLDPLHQSIQLVCSNLHHHLDVAVYMLNCLNAIRSVIILYQYTENKLEMIKAQIDANEDVLVSEQASQILINCDLIDIYRKSLAHHINQGPLSKITDMGVERVDKAILLFNNFLKKPDGFQFHQTLKISSARVRESVRLRTFENVIGAYTVIFNELSNPENGYTELKNLKPIEEVKSVLLK